MFSPPPLQPGQEGRGQAWTPSAHCTGLDCQPRPAAQAGLVPPEVCSPWRVLRGTTVHSRQLTLRQARTRAEAGGRCQAAEETHGGPRTLAGSLGTRESSESFLVKTICEACRLGWGEIRAVQTRAGGLALEDAPRCSANACE